jgi:hypothetical protein
MPSKTVEVNGNFRILVQKDQFNTIRRELRKNLPSWYKQYVSKEAHPREGQYRDEPKVAPLEEDGYSSGEDTYTAKSIATAFSYEGSIPSFNDNMNQSEDSQHFQHGVSFSAHAQENATWADKVRGNMLGSKSANTHGVLPVSPQNTSDLVSDLASSRAEVEELKLQMTELTASFETQRAELVAFFKDEMARSLLEQLKVFTQHQQQQSPPPLGEATIDQVVLLIQNQDRKFQALTDMVASMMSMANTTNDKRPPDEMNESFKSTDTHVTQLLEKRLDRKMTPSKQLFTKDTDCSQQFPSHADHEEMDLADVSLPPGSTNDSSYASGGKVNQDQSHD